MEEQHQSFDVCIVCALSEEASAVIIEFSARCHTSFTKAYHGQDHYEHHFTTIRNMRGEPLSVLVTWLPEVGPTATAQEIRSLVQQFHPRFIAMAGICAGDQCRVQLGDLIIASSAYQYDEGKVISGSEGQIYRQPAMRTVSPTDQILQYVRGFRGWVEPIREMKVQFLQHPSQAVDSPKLVVAPMASGMAVRADTPFAWLQEHYHRNTVALDMEAASFYFALRTFHALVVKAVCDYADLTKNDAYHDYAARVSAVYLLHFIQEYVTEETMPRPPEPSQRSFSTSFDSTLCREASLDALNGDGVKKFLTQEKVQQLQNTSTHLDPFGRPPQIAFLSQDPPTYAALLCFGKNPTKAVPGAYLRCTYWKGETREIGWHEDQEYRGSLLEQYEAGRNFLQRYLRLQRVIDNNRSIDEWEIPLRVLEEAVANALIHREYTDMGRERPVHIEIYNDRTEICSPGEPLLPIDQLGIVCESHQRNPLITQIFYLDGNVEKVGSGIQRMQMRLQKAQLPLPVFELSPSKTFKVLIRRPLDPLEVELKEKQAQLEEVQGRASHLEQRQKKTSRLVKILSGLIPLLALIGIGGGGWWYYASIPPDPTLVTTLIDSGTGSLRWAIAQAPAGSTITFASGLKGTIYLTRKDLELKNDITLLDSRLGNISISGGSPQSQTGHTISINSMATVIFENLSFTGTTTWDGAFIRNQGHLTLTNCIVSGNTSYNTGGGLENRGGSLTLNNTEVSGNTAGDAAGGIYNWNGYLTLNNSTVSHNRATYNGGGIFGRLGSVNLVNSTVENNETTGQPGDNPTGGGIDLVNSLLIVNTSGSGSTRSVIQDNSTKGSGGGITLQGSQATITNATITRNYAGQNGGGIAVEKDTEDDKVGFAMIVDMEITNTPKTLSFLGGNLGPQNPNIFGKLSRNSSKPLIISVSGGTTGTPAPVGFSPEQSPQYRGAADFDAFCQFKGYQEFQTQTPYNPYTLSCVATAKPNLPFQPFDACTWQAHATNVMTRLAAYFDPSSWQCYVDEKKLGNIATQDNLNNFCKSIGNKGVLQVGPTAYDWQCESASGLPVGLSMANACQWLYPQHRTDAFDSLVNYNKASGWECWAPR